jgi:hypothetical protein
LLKTFSKNPFQGQNPNIAVRINTTPINPAIQREIPSMEKAKTIKMIPMIERKIASALPTFFVLIPGSMFFLRPLIVKNKNPCFFEKKVSFYIAHAFKDLCLEGPLSTSESISFLEKIKGKIGAINFVAF